MKHILFILLAVSSGFTPAYASGNVDLTTPNARKFSEVARAAGVEFLMVKFYGYEFAQFVGRLSQPHATYKGAMTPLLANQVGKHAQPLITNGDMISEGERFTTLGMWGFGAVFPVEILDRLAFRLETRRDSVDSSEGLDHFRQMILNIDQSHVADAADAVRAPFEFVLLDAVAIKDAAYLWVPQPLFEWYWQHRGVLGDGSPDRLRRMLESERTTTRSRANVRITTSPYSPSDLPQKELMRELRNRIRIRLDHNGDLESWANVMPVPLADGVGVYDPTLGLAQWATVVPDWARVRAAMGDIVPQWRCGLLLEEPL